jgi:RimJ/RimL family protein N-acetyltransferase
MTVALEVPIIETDRLLMRGWTEADLDSHAKLCADPEVMMFMGGPVDRVESWRRLAMHAGHWALKGYGDWVLERRTDRYIVGRAGLWHPEGWPGVEVGWKLSPDAWGQGFATEAARASIDWAWANLDVPTLISVIHPQNVASLRVAERVGMQCRERLPIRGETLVVMAIDRT